ncbi:hypothetical protein F5878DRAFT_607554 [Lentinula raphanica]|uniref:Uncharacterized protein n=1 Tax=Lentinula raphanica TaxID=153919 RepID=A0AA38PGU3_9AGAR|nr:hypothetical protein F5880DRAFT_510534 [Lentinula raphanica]KAJ3842471.1 hypothetical protein F5878DRAFT_607554 [Lentinula raphanica]
MARGNVAQFKLKLKKIYTRITRNRLTAVFFLFGFFHCFAQGIIQSLLFVLDSQYYTLLFDITQAAQIPPSNHTNLLHVSGGGYTLELCDYIPHNATNCETIFDSRNTSNVVADDPDNDAQLKGEIILSQLKSQSFSIAAEGTSPSLPVTQITFEAAEDAGTVNMSALCTETLLYPTQHFQNNKREEIAFMFLQFWLFVLSVIAMIHDSVPHVLTVFTTRILLTAWSIYSLWRTEWQQSVFQTMIETPGSPCSIALFEGSGGYFAVRVLYEIPDLILNCTALGISAFLSWTLLRTYNTETFTYVGAPKAITDLYKYFLALQVCLQLEAFVIITAAGLWIDQLFNTYIHTISQHTLVYEVIVILYAVLLGPWLVMAWYGIRHEHRSVTLAFIAGGGLFLLGSLLMFTSDIYRWMFYAWPCLGCFITASIVLLVSTVVLGVVCLRNFDKGLAHYLHAQATLSSSDFAPEVFTRDVESTYSKDDDDLEKLKVSLKSRVQSQNGDFTTYYLPNLGRESYLSR